MTEGLGLFEDLNCLVEAAFLVEQDTVCLLYTSRCV